MTKGAKYPANWKCFGFMKVQNLSLDLRREPGWVTRDQGIRGQGSGIREQGLERRFGRWRCAAGATKRLPLWVKWVQIGENRAFLAENKAHFRAGAQCKRGDYRLSFVKIAEPSKPAAPSIASKLPLNGLPSWPEGSFFAGRTRSGSHMFPNIVGEV